MLLTDSIWLSEATHPRREHVLPSGKMHIVFTLWGRPPFGFPSLIAGARDTFYVKHTTHSRSVGAVLRPGACEWLFGVPASALAHTHTDLSLIWPDAPLLREELCESADPIRTLHSILLRRAPKRRGIPPHISHALMRLDSAPIAQIVNELGCSHRHFTRTFEDAVGLTPKRYARVQRMQSTLHAHGSLADTAFAAGFADQAHFTRDFRAFSGVTPTEYRRLAPPQRMHVPVDFIQDRPR